VEYDISTIVRCALRRYAPFLGGEAAFCIEEGDRAASRSHASAIIMCAQRSAGCAMKVAAARSPWRANSATPAAGGRQHLLRHSMRYLVPDGGWTSVRLACTLPRSTLYRRRISHARGLDAYACKYRTRQLRGARITSLPHCRAFVVPSYLLPSPHLSRDTRAIAYRLPLRVTAASRACANREPLRCALPRRLRAVARRARALASELDRGAPLHWNISADTSNRLTI